MNADKRLCIECIKMLENIQFTESIEDENTIGYIDDNNRHIKVLYLEDNLGAYIALAYSIQRDTNTEGISLALSTHIVNGRYEVCDNNFLISSIFPILDEQYLFKQFKHAIVEIWAMANIIINAPE